MRVIKEVLLSQEQAVFVCDYCGKGTPSILVPEGWYIVRKVKFINEQTPDFNDADFCSYGCLQRGV